MFAIMYFLIIRPQQKQLKEQRSLLSALKKGDEVVTQAGCIGRIVVIADKVVHPRGREQREAARAEDAPCRGPQGPTRSAAKADEGKAEKEEK